MVRIRENRYQHATRHAVTTVLVRLHLPADAVALCAVIMKAGWRKEAAP